MIIYVDLEHERVQKTEQWQESFAKRLKVKYRLEDLSGEPCLIVRYKHMTPELVRELHPRAVLISGCATEIDYYAEKDLSGLRQIMCEPAQPTLGFCGGEQLMAQTFGIEIAPMGKLGADVDDPYPGWDYAQGMAREFGFTPVRVLAPHPLLEGLGPAPLMFEAHYWEAKAVPSGFRLHASTELCGVQMITHENKPLYATQFHPEQWDDEHPDGRTFLQNFFRLAGITS